LPLTEEEYVMASVTNIKTITNRLPYPITIKNGENTQETFTVNADSGWNGDLWVPWIGGNDEKGKAIHVKVQSADVWIFQDYWKPAGKDAIKHHVAPELDYNKAEEIDGNNRGGGEKSLIFFLKGRDLRMEMM
jgi:hypothetical protein